MTVLSIYIHYPDRENRAENEEENKQERKRGCLLLHDFSLRKGFEDSVHFFCYCSQCKLKLLLRKRKEWLEWLYIILYVCLCLHVYLGLNHGRSLISQVFQCSSNINLFSTYKETEMKCTSHSFIFKYSSLLRPDLYLDSLPLGNVIFIYLSIDSRKTGNCIQRHRIQECTLILPVCKV